MKLFKKKQSKEKTWAEREVELACKRENPDWDGKSFDYGCSCYQSALKALKSMEADSHSGFSWYMTVNIFNRLARQLPLTPIEDSDDIWRDCGDGLFQCIRMSSLFKKVHQDGSVTYHDNYRSYGIVNGSDIAWSGSRESKPVDKFFPIKMPYYPVIDKYKVCFHSDDDKYPYMIVEPNGRSHLVKKLTDGQYVLID